MAAKYRKTECTALEWEQFLLLVDRLKKTTEYRFPVDLHWLLLWTSVIRHPSAHMEDILDKELF